MIIIVDQLLDTDEIILIDIIFTHASDTLIYREIDFPVLIGQSSNVETFDGSISLNLHDSLLLNN